MICPNCGNEIDFDACYVKAADAVKCDCCGRLISQDDIDELIPDATPAETIYIWL